MAEEKTFGYRKIFGIILPGWVTERMVRTVAWSVLVMVVMLFVLILVISPQRENIAQYEETLKADMAKLESLKKSRDGIERIDSDLDEREIENIMTAMPLEYSPERAIYVLRQIAADTGVSIVSYTLPSGIIVDSKGANISGSSKQMVDLLSYIIKITVSAPVEEILKFVAKIESSLPYGVVSDLNLQEVTKLTKIVAEKNVQIALELKYFQSKTNAININSIETLTPKNLENARKLAGYNLFTLPEDTGIRYELATRSGDIFGF